MKQFLCKTTALDATGAKSLNIEINGVPLDIFLVRDDNGIYAYIDRCPHKGTPLEWQEDHFLDDNREHIVCATHGAKFHIADGYCFDGPCAQQSLSALPLEIENGDIYLVA